MNKMILSAISLSVFIIFHSTPNFATNTPTPAAGTQLALYFRLNLSSRHNSDYHCSNCSEEDYPTDENDAGLD